MPEADFENEADLVRAFCKWVEEQNQNRNRHQTWTIYPETGFDLLLASDRGLQIGIEAKMSLNAKVLCQAIPLSYAEDGPDYRAVLVPAKKCVSGMEVLARHLGITVLMVSRRACGYRGTTDIQVSPYQMPTQEEWSFYTDDWWPWCPTKRITLPDYVPDVEGGKPSPLTLTPWKVKAIKLMIVLARRGYVTRKDMKALQISPTTWTAHSVGYLVPNAEKTGYVRCGRTPDFTVQHPRNYAEIEADFDRWCPEEIKTTLPAAVPAQHIDIMSRLS